MLWEPMQQKIKWVLQSNKQKRNQIMFYQLKKDCHISIYNGYGYILSTELNKMSEVDPTGAVFIGAVKQNPQSLEQLVDNIIKSFSEVDRETLTNDAREFYDSFVDAGFLIKGETLDQIESFNKTMKFVQPPINEASVNFYLPGLDMDFVNFYTYFARYSVQHKDWFMDNSRIASFYGTFKNTVWAGGRLSLGMMVSPIDMERTIHKINDAGIAARYTFTNNMMEERHLNDTLCNLAMEIADNGKNEVLVNSPVLEKYLREQYPNFKFIQSITACQHSIEKINEATEKYDLVVIDFHDNRNMDFLEKIKNKNKIEILVDGLCPNSCNRSKEHYSNISRINCLQGNANHEYSCLINKESSKNFYKGLRQRKENNLTFEEVYKDYFDMGFRHFKLVGRNEFSFYVLESLVYYLVKPEHRDEVRADLADYYIEYMIKTYGGKIKPALDRPYEG